MNNKIKNICLIILRNIIKNKFIWTYYSLLFSTKIKLSISHFSLFLALKPSNSIRTIIFKISTPWSFNNLIIASSVPPVAKTSSIITAFWPFLTKPFWISNIDLPYSKP
ncbi:adenine phosphoribosyl transferase [Metamycoplasma canadense]|uniref:Adenine phosphoribosyl transferase n=1 Tax=Metamycoplasma canadense TaxID=29554 RepID=A0A077L6D3_9BACT|nr:adenine phosphoribosyl transferase [Metamycoplasma canadense]